MFPRFIGVAVLALGFLAQAAGAQAQQPVKPAENPGPPPLPTMDELREMYDSGDYRTAVQQIARVLRLRGAPAQPYDRDALQLLRGQTLLALDDPRAAKRSFDEAQKSAQNDIAMKAHGYFALLSRSKMNMYKKRTGDKAEINISDPRLLVDAFTAVLDDELPAFQGEAATAVKANNLQPAIAIVPKLLDLASIEFAATGKYERVQPIGKQVGDHARDLIEKELTMQDQRITGIENMANQLIDTGGYVGRGTRRGGGGWWNSSVTRRGLVSDERENLYQLIEYLEKVEDSAKRGQTVAKAVEGDVAAWDAVVEHAQQVKAHGQSVLEAEGVRTATDTSNR
ncbi:MAG: hypothetical protein H7Z14_16705 [Anaerolineae bacterium]|nr:hypothetical protein [Phycisphaerae bacterium]